MKPINLITDEHLLELSYCVDSIEKILGPKNNELRLAFMRTILNDKGTIGSGVIILSGDQWYKVIKQLETFGYEFSGFKPKEKEWVLTQHSCGPREIIEGGKYIQKCKDCGVVIEMTGIIPENTPIYHGNAIDGHLPFFTNVLPPKATTQSCKQ